MDNSTFPYYTEKLQGHTSFEFYPCHQDLNYTYYKGMHFSTNRINQVKVLVRLSTREPFSNNDVKDLLRATKCAEMYMEKFLKQCQVDQFLRMRRMTHPSVQPVVIRVASTARWMNRFFKVIKGHNKKLKKDEYGVIEERLSGENVTFIDEYGHPTMETKETDVERLLQAFCHYTLVSSGKTLVVCGLTGVQNGQDIRLSIPCVHSVEQTFGADDQGKQGIENFVKNHKCNSLCKQLSPLKDDHNHIRRHTQSDKATLRRTKRGVGQVYLSAQAPVFSRQA